MSLPLDPARLRANFPAFSEPSLRGQAFFQNAGGSYMARQVIDRLTHFYTCTKVQPGDDYPASEEAQAAMDDAHVRIAAALNVTPDWIHFGPSTSANTYILGHAFAGWLKPGDAIVVTDQDHEANTGNWRRLAKYGIEVREWRIDRETARLSLDALDAILDERVKLIAFPHASNIVAEINDVAAVTERARNIGAVTAVDGVSYAPHGLPDLKALGADIYLFSGYKVYGPHQGIMAIRPELALSLPNQGHTVNEGNLKKILTPAGPDHAQIAASAGIVDYLEAVAEIAGGIGDPYRRAHEAMRAQEQALLAPLMDYLRGRNTVRVIGPTDPAIRAPTVALHLGEPGAIVAKRLAKHGIMAAGGSFYSYRLVGDLGIDPHDHGVLRLSFVHYTTPEEVSRLVTALDAEL